MDYRYLSLVGLMLIARPFLPENVALGDEPNAEQLVKRIPVLSPDNESLRSFSFIGEFATPAGVPVVFEACWVRENGFGFALIDQFGFPVLFIAQKQMMLYDASDGLVTLGEDCNPSVIIQVKERRAVAVCGVESLQKAAFIIDMPSFIPNQSEVTRTFRQLPNNLWELRDLHSKGGEFLLVFDPSEEWPLKRMEVLRDRKPMLIIRDIAINKPVPHYLTRFPSVDEFPADLATDRLADRDTDFFADPISLPQRFVRSLAAPSAIRDPKLRSFPFSKDVNWEEVERRHKVTGPKLSSLLDFQINGRTLK